MRYLAIDLGDKRTGLATGDELTRFVAPLRVLEIPRGPALLDAIERAIREQEPGALVLGLPLNMDGSEGERAKLVRAFGTELAERTGLPVEYQDERLTSDAANQRMARSGRTRQQKKQIRDAVAAAEILQDFLDRCAGMNSER